MLSSLPFMLFVIVELDLNKLIMLDRIVSCAYIIKLNNLLTLAISFMYIINNRRKA